MTPVAAAPAKTAPAKTAKPEHGKTITRLAESCPSKVGTVRAQRWAKLKSGMTVAEALAAQVPAGYLKRMEAAGHLKIG